MAPFSACQNYSDGISAKEVTTSSKLDHLETKATREIEPRSLSDHEVLKALGSYLDFT